MPQLHVVGGVEVDVATVRSGEASGGTATYAPPKPTLTAPLDATGIEQFTVRVMRNFGGPQLRACIELVSPANKDRDTSRRAFATQCANHLRGGISVIVVGCGDDPYRRPYTRKLCRHSTTPKG